MITNFRRFKKSSQQTVFFSIFLGLLFLTMIGFLVYSSWKINQRRTELQSKIEAFKKEIQVLEEKNRQLRAGILQTTKESYWEEKIRGEGYKKPGEEQIVVLPPEEKREEGIKTESVSGRLLEKIKDFFARVVQW